MAGVDTFGEPGYPAIVLLIASSADRWDDTLCWRLATGSRFVIRSAVGDTVDVIDQLDRLDVRVAHVVAAQPGIDITRRLAAEHPDRVRSLILVSTDPAAPSPDTADVPIEVLHVGDDGSGWGSVVSSILRITSGGWDEQADRLAARALADGDPTRWFDQLYSAGAAGEVPMPWSRLDPHPLLAQWVLDRDLHGTGERAIVVGTGLGADAQFIAAAGFDTTAMDVSPTAISLARQRFPDTPVEFTQADLFDLPAQWLHRFDLVVEIFTVQALPRSLRADATRNVSSLVAEGGILFVVSAVRSDSADADPGPPWPLTAAEIEAFTDDGLDVVEIKRIESSRWSGGLWQAEFRRPARP